MATSNTTIERWKLLNFRQIQTELDSFAADIAGHQGENELSRKALIDKSKEFRQNSTDEVRKLVQPLVKSFQAEVDNLLKRNKAAESAFLSVYKTFADLPDPSSIIDYLADLEKKAAENKQLRESLEDHSKQLASSKIQETKRNQEELAEQEAKSNELLEAKIKVITEELTEQFKEKEVEWAQEKTSMEKHLADAEEQVGILRRELDRSHSELSRSRMINGQSDNEKISLFAEDLDRANERATAAELQIGELQQQLSTLQKQVNKTQELSPESSSRVTQNQQQDAVQRLHDEFDRMKESYQKQLDRMEDQLSRLSSQNALLTRKLENQRDYDDLKQELSLLKSAHYAEDLNNGSVESVLVNRNRRLEYENTGLRVREAELAGHHMKHSRPTNGHSLSHYLNSGSCSDGEPDSASPEEDNFSDDPGEIDISDLTPEMVAKINEARTTIQTLHVRATGSSGRSMNPAEVAELVNRVLEEEGITRSALAKFVLHGSYKMIYDALNEPRTWGSLNSAGRDKYRKLKMWAEDPRSINAVKILQVYSKRRRSDSMDESETLIEEPTDLSLPKTAARRKAFIPQRESSASLSIMENPVESVAAWFPRSTAYTTLHSTSSAPSFIQHPVLSRRAMFSVGRDHVMESYSSSSKEDLNESHSPKSQALPLASKRASPQHSVPRRHSRDSGAPSLTSMSTSSHFRPSASFTASPVALGIAFPDYRKNVLHQITDDMINQYDPLDTDQVTRHVRTKLNKCNVSQRLFGEVVLGMSQGAVSDLLKRPKPWNKLTRPTKEHYVRMQQFLEDEQSIPVLQAIQNREDPERILASLNEEEEDKTAESRDIWKNENSPHSSGNGSTLQINVPPATPVDLPPPPPPRVISESELSEREAFQAVKEHFAKFYQISDVSRGGMADTIAVASRIKEELRSRNLQQKLIGELVLDVGQGTVSELLNKPKPFNMLSMKGRENYMKLLKLLQTPEDFTLLEALRTQGQQKEKVVRLETDHLSQLSVLKEQKSLITQLENDLFRLKELAGGLRSSSEYGLKEPDFVTDAIRSELAHFNLSDIPVDSTSLAQSSAQNPRESAAYLSILERQHGRYYSRIKELEESNQQLQTKVIALKTDLEALRNDNVRLYERIRFLQSYEGRKPEVRVSVGHSNETEARYSSAYEENLDPFSSFNRSERIRKYQSLNPVDKATLAMGQMILGNSVSRKAFFFYALLLHLLVFGIIYKLALNESSLREFSYDCASRFSDHMHRVHGKD